MSSTASTICRSKINNTEIKKNKDNINNAATIAKWRNYLRHV